MNLTLTFIIGYLAGAVSTYLFFKIVGKKIIKKHQAKLAKLEIQLNNTI
jgi:hypothetical protein